MTPRQGGWRSARNVAPAPQATGVVATPAHGAGRSSGSAQVPGGRGYRRRLGAAAANVVTSANSFAGPARWSVSFIGVLAYIYAAVTYGLPIVGPSIVIALLGLILERTRIVVPLFLVLFALFVTWSGASYTASYEPDTTMNETITLGKLLLITFVIVNVTRDRWRVRTFMIFFLACFAAYPTRGTLVNYFIVGYTRFGRALWNFIYSNSNDLAALAFFPLSLSVGLALTEPKRTWIQRVSLIGVAVLALMILLTQSRGALIALVVSGLLFFLAHARGKRLRSLLMAAAMAVVIIPFVPKSAWQRFSGMANLTSTTTIVEADPEGSAEARYNIWRVARVIISENPISGIGLGAYPRAHASYAPRVGVPLAAVGFRDTHSTYLNVAAETGLPGLFLFLTMIATVAVATERVRRRAKGTPRAEQLFALELGLLAFLLAGVFGSFAKLSFLYIQLAVMWAMCDLTKREIAAAEAAGRVTRSQRAMLVRDRDTASD
jgi:O-antigen ligase